MSSDPLADAIDKILAPVSGFDTWGELSGEVIAAAIRGGALEAHGVLIVEPVNVWIEPDEPWDTPFDLYRLLGSEDRL